jgi:alpha-amylase
MQEIRFIFVVHNHQPVGNFGHVFEKAFDTCYRPFLDLLAAFPAVRVGLHYSGPLIEWIEENRPDFFDGIRDLCTRGQVEVLTGGFYEPMLAVLPDRDARGQVDMLSDFIRRRFRQEPRGLWLAERVWEPDIPRMLDGTGVEYTLADDSHFSYAGLDADSLHGYYITDKAGKTLSVFPISQQLRYMIPFKPVADTLDFLRQAAWRRFDAVTYGDDGEKFGLWPGTFQWVIEQGWLARFFQAMTDSSDWVRMALPGELVSSHRPTARVYLPTASYEEMMEWSLPSAAVPRFRELRDRLKGDETWDRFRPFVRGGLWQNFLARYPEANRMYRRMLRVSDDVHREAAGRRGKPPKAIEDARRDLYRAQCNCAYWHGLFGGLYLNNLRHAVYTHLNRATKTLDDLHGGEWARSRIVDADDDLQNEAILESRGMTVTIRPAQSGAVEGIELKDHAFCLTNTLCRRPEGYHDRIREAAGRRRKPEGDQAEEGPARVKENGLEDLLVYDRFERLSFLDHFVARGTDVWHFQREQYDDLGDFSSGAWEAKRKDQSGYASVRLSRIGTVRLGDAECALRAEKSYTLHARHPVLTVSYRFVCESGVPPGLLFAPELNLSLLAGDDPKRRVVIPGTPERVEPPGRVLTAVGLTAFTLQDEWLGMKATVTVDPIAELWHFPVETVSQSEDGFERTYQGSAFILVFPFNPPPAGAAKFTIQLKQE